jgi:hypothetical protein
MPRKPVSMIITSAIFICAIAWTTGALANAYAVYATYKKITINQDACLERSVTVLGNSGFTGMIRGTAGTNTTTVGSVGDYTALVRCAAGDPEIAMFVVTGPDANTSSSYVTAIANAF